MTGLRLSKQQSNCSFDKSQDLPEELLLCASNEERSELARDFDEYRDISREALASVDGSWQ